MESSLSESSITCCLASRGLAAEQLLLQVLYTLSTRSHGFSFSDGKQNTSRHRRRVPLYQPSPPINNIFARTIVPCVPSTFIERMKRFPLGSI